MVLDVAQDKTWLEVANYGEFKLKNNTLKGALYINSLGELTNDETETRIGFIENGYLYLLIEHGISASLGSQGPQGAQGTAGAQGPQGLDGSIGLQGAQGPQGSQGIAGLQGPQGDAGIAGSQGPQGSQGLDGSAGAQGSQGPQGDAGIQGPQGSQGNQGSAGPQGSVGVQGPQGPQGNQGIAGSVPSMALDDLTDVNTASQTTGDILVKTSDGQWKPGHVTISTSAPTGTPGTLDWIWFVVDP